MNIRTYKLHNILTSRLGVALLITLFAISILGYQSAQAARLDPNFGESGYALTPLELGAFQNMPQSLMQSDGSIVTVVSPFIAGYHTFYTQRLTSDGHPDGSFGDSGSTFMPITSGHDNLVTVAIDSFGRMVLAGYGSTAAGELGSLLFMRLLPDGSLDSVNFGNSGVAEISEFGAGQLYDMLVDEDDNIYVTARVTTDNVARDVIIKLQPNGVPDPLFDGDGALELPVKGTVNLTMAFDKQGGIVVAGEDNQMARLSLSGVLDENFGLARASIPGTPVAIIVNQVTGDIFLGSTAVDIQVNDTGNTIVKSPVITCFSADGTPNRDFASTGSIKLTGDGTLRGIFLSPQGKPIITLNFGNYDVAFLNERGDFDPQFDNDGKLNVESETAVLNITDIVEMDNNSVTVTGVYVSNMNVSSIFAARVIETGTNNAGSGNPNTGEPGTGETGGNNPVTTPGNSNSGDDSNSGSGGGGSTGPLLIILMMLYFLLVRREKPLRIKV